MCVCVCVLFLDLFQDDLRCLFSPHQVNHGGVQKSLPEVSLYSPGLFSFYTQFNQLCRHESRVRFPTTFASDLGKKNSKKNKK